MLLATLLLTLTRKAYSWHWVTRAAIRLQLETVLPACIAPADTLLKVLCTDLVHPALCQPSSGTLTVQGLELQSIVPVSNGRFEPPNTDMQQLPPSIPQLLASCHGLAWLGDMLVGDPLDQKLFAATGWALVDQLETEQPRSGQQQQQDLAIVHPAGHPDQQLRIVRRFEFSSQLMRNLVVVQLSTPPSSSSAANGIAASAAQHASGPAAHPLGAGGAVADLLGGPVVDVCLAPDPGRLPPAATHMLYVKGSPEVIKELVQSSSVPPDFDSVLAEYTREGLRVLALAQGAVLPGMLPEGGTQSLTQQQLEASVPLQLVGLAVLANPLRPDSAGAIQDLHNALVGCTSWAVPPALFRKQTCSW